MSNDEKGDQAYKEVVRLFRGETNEWYHLSVSGEEITCTGNHPFYVSGKGFVKAKDLTKEDKLVQSDGSLLGIDSIQIEALETPETKYNFEVEDYHTYYVTESDVLVHNDCIEGKLAEIANKYDNLQCTQAADEMKAFLRSNGIEGYQVEIQFSGIGQKNFVVSDIFNSNMAISYNGYHTGIMYKGIVYDNIHKTGLPLQQWLDDFYGLGERIVKTTRI